MTSCSCCRTESEPANPLLIEANALTSRSTCPLVIITPRGEFQDRAVSPGTRLRILLRARQFLFSPRSIRPHETASIPLPRSALRSSVTRSVFFYLFSPRSDPFLLSILYFTSFLTFSFFFFFNFSTEIDLRGKTKVIKKSSFSFLSTFFFLKKFHFHWDVDNCSMKTLRRN